jgi:hypothetical protein
LGFNPHHFSNIGNIKKIATSIVHNEDVPPICTRKTVEDGELRCQCCVKLEIELNEVISELKSATEIIKILKEELGIANMTESNNMSNIHNEE